MADAIQKTVLCFVIVNNKILLLERQNTWYENMKYLPPGGNVDADETPRIAAARELFEETDIRVDSNYLKLIREYESETNGRLFHSYYFLAQACEGVEDNKEPSRHSNIGWFPLDGLPENTSKVVYDTLELL